MFIISPLLVLTLFATLKSCGGMLEFKKKKTKKTTRWYEWFCNLLLYFWPDTIIRPNTDASSLLKILLEYSSSYVLEKSHASLVVFPLQVGTPFYTFPFPTLYWRIIWGLSLHFLFMHFFLIPCNVDYSLHWNCTPDSVPWRILPHDPQIIFNLGFKGIF